MEKENMLNSGNMPQVKRLLKRHYNLSRLITDDEAIAEVNSLNGRSWHYIYDDKQRRLASALNDLGVVKLTYDLSTR